MPLEDDAHWAAERQAEHRSCGWKPPWPCSLVTVHALEDRCFEEQAGGQVEVLEAKLDRMLARLSYAQS